MIGKYGDLIFSTSDQRVQNFLDLKRDTPARYANHETINTKPKAEFLGPGLDTLTFSMELNAFMGVTPTTIINQLRDLAERGEVARFVLGGRNFGRFKITGLSESYGVITNRGGVATAKVDITLEEYR